MNSSLATTQDRISHVAVRGMLLVLQALLAGALLWTAEGGDYVFALLVTSTVVWRAIALVRFVLRHRPWFRRTPAPEGELAATPVAPYR